MTDYTMHFSQYSGHLMFPLACSPALTRCLKRRRDQRLRAGRWPQLPAAAVMAPLSLQEAWRHLPSNTGMPSSRTRAMASCMLWLRCS